MLAAPALRFTFREYLSVDEGSSAKPEYLHGMILGMADRTPEHARLAAAVVMALGRALVGKPCVVFSEALRVRAVETGFAGYPDVTVVCDELLRDPEDKNTVTNPTAVVEVLSPSTEDHDRGEKLRQYQGIVSLRYVVLVHHDRIQLDVWSRDGMIWTERSFRAGERATLHALGCELDVAALYRDPLVR